MSPAHHGTSHVCQLLASSANVRQNRRTFICTVSSSARYCMRRRTSTRCLNSGICARLASLTCGKKWSFQSFNQTFYLKQTTDVLFCKLIQIRVQVQGARVQVVFLRLNFGGGTKSLKSSITGYISEYQETEAWDRVTWWASAASLPASRASERTTAYISPMPGSRWHAMLLLACAMQYYSAHDSAHLNTMQSLHNLRVSAAIGSSWKQLEAPNRRSHARTRWSRPALTAQSRSDEACTYVTNLL